jgi:hypothetical protein
MKNRDELTRQFSAATGKWPNLQSWLIRWPEDKPSPNATDIMQSNLAGKAPPRASRDADGALTIHLTVAVTDYASYSDLPAQRFRSGFAGMLILRRSFGKASDFDDITPEDLQAGERFRVLSQTAAKSLEPGDASAESMRDRSIVGWMLVVHEKIEPPWKQLVGSGFDQLEKKGSYSDDYQVQIVDDVFLESSLAIESLNYSAAKAPSHWEGEFGVSWRTIKRRIDDGEIDAYRVATKRWRVHLRHMPDP